MSKPRLNHKLQYLHILDFAHRDFIGHWSLVIGTLKKTTYNIQHTTYKTRGFSLIEVLVAVSVLIISVTGTLSIIAREVSSAAIAKDQVVAFYLAQEALEYVRGVRDNNAIHDPRNSWLTGLDGLNSLPDCITNKCVIDVNADPLSVEQEVAECDVTGCDPLFLDSPSGVYNQQDDGDPTMFTREVQVVGIDDASSPVREVRVDATVRWTSGVERSFTISGNLFNWR